MRPIVYLSIEGILGHLGFSQVFRVVEGLSRRGVPYSLVSMERKQSLADAPRLAMVERRAREVGIDWVWGVYSEGGSVRAVSESLGKLTALGARQVLRHGSRLVHARAYHGGLAAQALLPLRTRWLFDPRGYWIDERLEEHRWFTTQARLRAARSVERRLFRSADAIVTLTQLQADDVTGGRFGPIRGRVEVIPTCADFEEFKPRSPDSLELVSAAHRRLLAGKLVLGVVGSLNRAYLGPETALLAAEVLRLRADARVVVLSSQAEQWAAAFRIAGVPPDRCLFHRADHEAMPEWLSLMDWGLLMLTPETFAKTAMMPTKLAEFFASGVRVCAHGCNREVLTWVQRAGDGIVLQDTGRTALVEAAKRIAGTQGRSTAARSVAAGHFSLASGLDRYEAILRQLGEGSS